MWHREQKAHVAVAHDVVCVLVLAVLLDDAVPVLRRLRVLVPGDAGPTVLGDERVIHLPPLKVDGDPGAPALRPARPHALERVPDGEQRLVGAFQPLVVLVYILAQKKKR